MANAATSSKKQQCGPEQAPVSRTSQPKTGAACLQLCLRVTQLKKHMAPQARPHGRTHFNVDIILQGGRKPAEPQRVLSLQ